MRFLRICQIVIVFILFSGCQAESEDSFLIRTMDFAFQSGDQGWSADFTDYPVGDSPEADSVYQWHFEHVSGENLPGGRSALLLSCNNVSGSVFMFLKRKIDNLRPNTNYALVFDVTVATNAVSGEEIILKAGGSELEPKKVIENGYYSLNVDKGDGFNAGETLFSFGDIGGGAPSSTEYSIISKGNANSYAPLVARSNSKGELWLIVGTDSMYGGINSVYYPRISVIYSVSN